MSEGGYKIRSKVAIHFITFAVVECLPDRQVFTRKDYRNIVLDSIGFCQQEKFLYEDALKRITIIDDPSALIQYF
jgi:hypothetical protein